MDNYINIGTLDTLVTIQQCVITQGKQGGKSYTFSDYSNVYANIDRRINEQVSIGNLEEGDYVSLTIYKIPDLTTRWRVKFSGRVYEITGIDPIDRLSSLCVLTLHDIGAAEPDPEPTPTPEPTPEPEPEPEPEEEEE